MKLSKRHDVSNVESAKNDIIKIADKLNRELPNIKDKLSKEQLDKINDALAIVANLKDNVNKLDGEEIKNSTVRFAKLVKAVFQGDVADVELRKEIKENQLSFSKNITPRALGPVTELTHKYVDMPSNSDGYTSSAVDFTRIAEMIVRDLGKRLYVSAQEAYDGYCQEDSSIWPYASPGQKCKLAKHLKHWGFVVAYDKWEKEAEKRYKEFAKLHKDDGKGERAEHSYVTSDSKKKVKLARRKKLSAGAISLESGQFGWDYIIENDDGDTILIQSDWDYPSYARAFGWDGDESDIQGAQQFLDDNIGKVVEDPGYFGEEENLVNGKKNKKQADQFGRTEIPETKAEEIYCTKCRKTTKHSKKSGGFVCSECPGGEIKYLKKRTSVLDKFTKKGQENSGSGWDRFLDFSGFKTWDWVIETGLGDPTPEEEKAILDGGLYGKQIDQKSINILKSGGMYTPESNFSLTITAEDGTSEKFFNTKEELISAAREYSLGDITGKDSWVGDYGQVFNVSGVTIDKIFPSVSLESADEFTKEGSAEDAAAAAGEAARNFDPNKPKDYSNYNDSTWPMGYHEKWINARDILQKAYSELGPDLGGYSPVDLLLDNMPELKNSDEARELFDKVKHILKTSSILDKFTKKGQIEPEEELNEVESVTPPWKGEFPNDTPGEDENLDTNDEEIVPKDSYLVPIEELEQQYDLSFDELGKDKFLSKLQQEFRYDSESGPSYGNVMTQAYGLTEKDGRLYVRLRTEASKKSVSILDKFTKKGQLDEFEEYDQGPQEGDVTTDDHEHWYLDGKLYFEGDSKGLANKLQGDNYFPNIYFISDHGNAHLINEDISQFYTSASKKEANGFNSPYDELNQNPGIDQNKVNLKNQAMYAYGCEGCGISEQMEKMGDYKCAKCGSMMKYSEGDYNTFREDKVGKDIKVTNDDSDFKAVPLDYMKDGSQIMAKIQEAAKKDEMIDVDIISKISVSAANRMKNLGMSKVRARYFLDRVLPYEKK